MDSLNFQDFDRGVNSSDADFRAPGQIGDQAQLFTTDPNKERRNLSQKKNFLSFDFYQQYFDIDSEQVFSRIMNSMIPKSGSNFITDHIQPFPDLYGPFWISVTLVFATAICGNLAKYIESLGDVVNQKYGSDFRLVTGASTIIFCYVVLVPCGLFSLFWYRKSEMQYSYLDLLCAYGYSLSIFIPVSILWVMQMQWFRWLLIIISVLLSGSVLAGSIWPAVKNDRNQLYAFCTIAAILFLHAILAIGFKEYYFDASQSTQQLGGIGKIEHVDVPLKLAHVEQSTAKLDSATPKVALQAANQLKSDELEKSIDAINATVNAVLTLKNETETQAPEMMDSQKDYLKLEQQKVT